MPTRNRNLVRMLLPFGLVAVAVLGFLRRKSDDWEYETAAEDAAVRDIPLASQAGRRRGPTARLALVAAFTTLFFAGAAFTAGAGDQLAKMLDPEDAAALRAAHDEAVAAAAEAPTATVEAPPAVPEAAPEPAPEAAPEVAPEAAASDAAPAATAGAPAAAPTDEVADAVGHAVATQAAPVAEPNAVAVVKPVVQRAASSQAAPSIVSAPKARAAQPVTPKAKAPATKKWVLKRAAAPAPAPEIDVVPGYGEPTIWLNRALPDPTPPSARLTRTFARQLVSVSKRHGADWAAVLGVLRAQGERGSAPASTTELNTMAARLAKQKAWRGALALSGRTAFADSADALADMYRAVGIEALVTGFEASKKRLAKRVLAAENVWIYDGGREDIAAGRIDVRVLVAISYLRERHGEVTVSSLFTGHRKFSRPGVVSAHTYGQAVDIAAIGEISIAGNQQPGGVTEAAVRSLLLLPAELQPRQVISLLGLGGASFPMANHGDHIHVGF